MRRRIGQPFAVSRMSWPPEASQRSRWSTSLPERGRAGPAEMSVLAASALPGIGRYWNGRRHCSVAGRNCFITRNRARAPLGSVKNVDGRRSNASLLCRLEKLASRTERIKKTPIAMAAVKRLVVCGVMRANSPRCRVDRRVKPALRQGLRKRGGSRKRPGRKSRSTRWRSNARDGPERIRANTASWSSSRQIVPLPVDRAARATPGARSKMTGGLSGRPAPATTSV